MAETSKVTTGLGGTVPDSSDMQSLASANTLHTSAPVEHVIDERRHHKVSSLKRLWAKKGSDVSNKSGARVGADSSTVLKKKPPLFRKLLRKKNSNKVPRSGNRDELVGAGSSFEAVSGEVDSGMTNIVEDMSILVDDSKSVTSAKSASSAGRSSYVIKKSLSFKIGSIPIEKTLRKQVDQLPKRLKSESEISIAEALSLELLQNELYDEAMMLSEKIMIEKKLLYNDNYDSRIGSAYQNMANIEAILVNAKPQRGSYEQALMYYNDALKCFSKSNNSDASLNGYNSRNDGTKTAEDTEHTTTAKYSAELSSIYGGMGDLYFEIGGEVHNAIDAYERHFELGKIHSEKSEYTEKMLLYLYHKLILL